MKDGIELFESIVQFELSVRLKLGRRFVGITKRYLLELVNLKRADKGFRPWSEPRFLQALDRMLNLNVFEESRGGISIAAPYRSEQKLKAEVLIWTEYQKEFTPQEIDSIKDFLKRKKFLDTLLSIEKENGKTFYVSTSMGTFYSDDLNTWKQLPVTVERKPGNNATGHYLPPSAPGDPRQREVSDIDDI